MRQYPIRCRIVDPAGEIFLPGLIAKTPPISKPHVGKVGLAEYTEDCNVRITLDDGTILMGYECWWESIKENTT